MGKAAQVLLAVLVAVPLGAQTDTHRYSPGTNLEWSELTQLVISRRLRSTGDAGDRQSNLSRLANLHLGNTAQPQSCQQL